MQDKNEIIKKFKQIFNNLKQNNKHYFIEDVR